MVDEQTPACYLLSEVNTWELTVIYRKTGDHTFNGAVFPFFVGKPGLV